MDVDFKGDGQTYDNKSGVGAVLLSCHTDEG